MQNNFDKIGEAIWIQAQRRLHSKESLLDIAAEIARGESLPVNDSTLPINFLANGERGRTLHLERENVIGTYWNRENLDKLKVEMPVSITLARASGLPEFCFNGSNFEALASLAKAKSGTQKLQFSESQLRGFGLDSAMGLSFVFSPWSDFCLLCWEFYDRLLQEGKRVEPAVAQPFLILSRDYYPLYIDALPGDEHRHHCGFACTRRKFQRKAHEFRVSVIISVSKVLKKALADLSNMRRHFSQPDSRFYRLNLAKEWANTFEFMMPPMLKQAHSFWSDVPVTGVGQVPPSVHL